MCSASAHSSNLSRLFWIPILLPSVLTIHLIFCFKFHTNVTTLSRVLIKMEKRIGLRTEPLHYNPIFHSINDHYFRPVSQVDEILSTKEDSHFHNSCPKLFSFPSLPFLFFPFLRTGSPYLTQALSTGATCGSGPALITMRVLTWSVSDPDWSISLKAIQGSPSLPRPQHK